MVLELLPELFAPWATKANETVLDPERRAFIDTYGPYARRYGAQTGIAPEVLLAMGASESNWGRAGSIFGIKGPGPGGQSQVYDTWEAGPNGERIPQKAEFATYANPDEAFQHFAQLLSTERYAPAAEYVKQTGDSAGFLRMINDAGYATDRNWANSIVALANGMGNGQFPDAPPPGQGKVTGQGIGISFDAQPTGNYFQDTAKLIVQKRIDATEARQAVVDEEARARLETDLSRPMPALSHETAQSPEYKITPPSVDTTLHPANGVATARLLGQAFEPSAGVDTGMDYGPATQQMSDTSSAMQRFKDMGSGPDVVGALTSTLPFRDEIRTGTQRAGQVATPLGVLDVARLGVNKATGFDLPQPSDVWAGIAAPQTYLDAALSVPGGAVKSGANAVRSSARGSGGLLGIIPKNKRQLESAMEQTLRVAEEAKQAVLARGGTAQEARQAAAAAMREAQSATAAVDDVTLAVDRGVESQKYTNTGRRLRDTATRMSDRMGPGVAPDERPKTGWTIKPKDAPEYRVETDLPHGYQDAGDEAMQRFERNVSDQNALNDRIRGQKAAGSAARSREAIAAMRANAPPAGAILDADGNVDIAATLADEAERIAREGAGPQTSDTLAEIARIAKVAGDPFAEGRRQFQQGDEGSVQGKPQQQPALPGMPPPTQAQPFNPLKEVMGVLGGMRTGFASGDLPVMRQGGVLVWGNRKVTLDALKKGVNAYKDEAVATAADNAMKADPLYQQAVDDGLHFHDFGPNAKNPTPNFSGMNDSRFSQLQRQLPWIKGSERATALFINHQAFEVYKDWTATMRAAGVTDTKRYEAVADVINHAVGYSGSNAAKVVGALNALFSAEYTFSRFNVLADPIVQMRNGNPEAAKLAAQNLMGLVGGNASMMTFLALTGQTTGKWSVNMNPTSSDFGQLRIGNTRYDTLAGFGPLFKTTARIAETVGTAESYEQATVDVAKDLFKYFENKEAPMVSLFTDAALRGRAPDPKEMAQMYVPGLASGIVEAVLGNLNDPTAAAVNAVGAGVGGSVSVGVNTYKTAADHANETAQQVTGRNFDELDTLGRLPVLAQLPAEAKRGKDNPMTAERQKYTAALEKAGYLGAPKDKDGKPVKETESEAKKRTTRNADVIASNPDLDVQRWFFEGSNAVHSLDAVDKALELGIKGRKVQYDGADRDLAATGADRAAWEKYGNVIDWYQNDLVKDPANLDAVAAQKYQGKKFAALKPTEQDAVKGLLKDAARNDPQTEAKLIFFGVEKPNKNGEYSASKPAVLEALQALWKEFPEANPLPKADTKIVVPAKRASTRTLSLPSGRKLNVEVA